MLSQENFLSEIYSMAIKFAILYISMRCALTINFLGKIFLKARFCAMKELVLFRKLG
jgi:hypothetical protein